MVKVKMSDNQTKTKTKSSSEESSTQTDQNSDYDWKNQTFNWDEMFNQIDKEISENGSIESACRDVHISELTNHVSSTVGRERFLQTIPCLRG